VIERLRPGPADPESVDMRARARPPRRHIHFTSGSARTGRSPPGNPLYVVRLDAVTRRVVSDSASSARQRDAAARRQLAGRWHPGEALADREIFVKVFADTSPEPAWLHMVSARH